MPPTADESPNPEAKRLSKYNTHVEQESVARSEARDPRLRRVTNRLQTHGPSEPPVRPEGPVPPRLTLKGDNLEKDVEGKPAEEAFRLQVPDILRRDALDLPAGPKEGPRLLDRSASEALRGNSDHLDLRLGSGAESKPEVPGGQKGDRDGTTDRPLPTLAALAPTLGTIARISGSPSMDHVEGVPEGDGTFLNAKEFKYATFFYRVRDSVRDFWWDLAATEYRRRDPTGQIYGVRDKATILHIQLNRRGELDDVHVEQTSGVEFLDRVAIDAIKRAQPFPNPPPGIVDEDGRVRFNFQFVLTMNAGRGLNLFRGMR